MGHRRLVAVAVVVAAVVLVGCGSETAPGHSLGTVPDSTPEAVATVAPGSPAVSAATAFLESLSSEQRVTAVLELGDSRRSNWSNLPPGSVRFERNGVRIGDLDLEQTDALHHFLAVAMSPAGYEVVTGIVRAEDALAESRGGDRSRFSAENYWLAFFGEPSDLMPWGWQFGGHHLAVNVTVADGRSYLSPTFLGIEPATFVHGNATVAPLDSFASAGRAVIDALDADARATATLASRPNGVQTGAGRDGIVPEIQGAAAGDWSPDQQQVLLDAIGLWVGVLDAASAQARMDEIRDELDDLHFAWHGEADGGPIYFRMQGPSLIIEFSTEGRLGGGGAHYHSVYRDPSNDYGRAAVAAT
ncbi:MAG: DUF3500 domain-containing protein [Chloroflexi bacterium]|nr:DUF3500 domain-containing protein [Chloroflexota bacterium]